MIPRGAVVAGLLALLATGALCAESGPVPGIAPADIKSGYEFQSPETRAMQDVDTDNPGMLWVLDGEALWRAKAGTADKACADCHDAAEMTMRGAATRYPAVDGKTGALLNLEQRIEQCRTERQGAPAWPYESHDLLAITAYVAHQSRGLPMSVAIDDAARPFFDAGQALYYTRQGQLNLACNQCHEANWGKQLRGDFMSQGHGNGYPIYRLDWQTMGSLQRRLKSCSTGVRAEPYAYGSPEYGALELYLAWRARGLPVETPAVRR